ncbi:amino acid transporter [Massarina eburnea CBS 473.64]|uniref:Amino acid transporter n=1 Tax=Massarina eburnea CBS 473.64 TaxID=1395130 RepID=A0A6A6S5X8_9PLEO|nr:amino acid transporter [Massarina eburnea CBS 473.64]
MAATNISQDLRDMQRLGKIQQYRRVYRKWETLGFMFLSMATWEYVLASFTGFGNGGSGGLFGMYIVTGILYVPVLLSLAEMTSMAPTAGSMHTWVSQHGPERHQKVLSYLCGWISCLGSIAKVSSSALVLSNLVQAMIDALRIDFEVKSWQSTLLALAFLLLSSLVNNWGSRLLHHLQVIAFGLHFTMLIILAMSVGFFASERESSDVLRNPISYNGWNIGVACLISQVSIVYCNLGSESVAHMSEEIKDASKRVPRSMIESYLVNVAGGLVSLTGLLLFIGPIEEVLQSKLVITVFLSRIQSSFAVFAIALVLAILIFLSNITAVATASRQVWAFSRDMGLPYSDWIRIIDITKGLPVHALYVTTIMAGIFCAFRIGGAYAFENTISLYVLSILSTYMMAIGCLIYARCSPSKTLPHRRFTLGRYGFVINIFAFFYCFSLMLFACLPTKLPITARNSNWAPLVWVTIIIYSAVAFKFHVSTRLYTIFTERFHA